MPNSSEVIVEVAGLNKTYRSGFWLKRVAGLTEVSLRIQQGEVFGLLGPNGAGKSTLFKVLTGLTWATAGEGRVAGHALGSRGAHRAIGYLPENPAVYDFLTGIQFLRLMQQLLGSEGGPTVESLLERVGLREKQHLLVRKYSKGMVQRLALAQALLGNPQLYILDEPMSGLDPVGRRLVRDIIGELRAAGKTVLFSSHVLSDAEALCDRVGLMLSGRITDIGDVATLVAASNLAMEIVIDASDFELDDTFDRTRVAVTRRGGQLVLFVRDDRALGDRLVKLAVTRGISIVSIQTHRETLEDYFLRRASESHPEGKQGALAES